MSKPNRLNPSKTNKSSQSHQSPQDSLTGVEKLAILNRYVFPVVAVILPMVLSRLFNWDLLIALGIGCLVFGTYQLIGYKNRWDHIHCSIQIFKRQRMTPHEINWDRISKFDATALPIAFVILGTFALLFGTNGM